MVCDICKKEATHLIDIKGKGMQGKYSFWETHVCERCNESIANYIASMAKLMEGSR